MVGRRWNLVLEYPALSFTHLCHWRAWWLGASHFPILNLSFLRCKKGNNVIIPDLYSLKVVVLSKTNTWKHYAYIPCNYPTKTELMRMLTLAYKVTSLGGICIKCSCKCPSHKSPMRWYHCMHLVFNVREWLYWRILVLHNSMVNSSFIHCNWNVYVGIIILQLQLRKHFHFI